MCSLKIYLGHLFDLNLLYVFDTGSAGNLWNICSKLLLLCDNNIRTIQENKVSSGWDLGGIDMSQVYVAPVLVQALWVDAL